MCKPHCGFQHLKFFASSNIRFSDLTKHLIRDLTGSFFRHASQMPPIGGLRFEVSAAAIPLSTALRFLKNGEEKPAGVTSGRSLKSCPPLI